MFWEEIPRRSNPPGANEVYDRNLKALQERLEPCSVQPRRSDIPLRFERTLRSCSSPNPAHFGFVGA